MLLNHRTIKFVQSQLVDTACNNSFVLSYHNKPYIDLLVVGVVVFALIWPKSTHVRYNRSCGYLYGLIYLYAFISCENLISIDQRCKG